MSAPAWDTERAAELARTAYRYVARVYPKDAPLEPIGRADMAVLEAQERRALAIGAVIAALGSNFHAEVIDELLDGAIQLEQAGG